MYSMVQVLQMRMMHQELFADGDYLPLQVVGEKNEHFGPVQLRKIFAGDTTPVVRHNRTEKHRH